MKQRRKVRLQRTGGQPLHDIRGDTTSPGHVLAIEASVAPGGAVMFMEHLITTAYAVVYEPIAATRLR